VEKQYYLQVNFANIAEKNIRVLFLLLENMRLYWYSGYTWDGKTSVYNPFSTMNFFQSREFAAYWFRIGTPSFLIDIIQRRDGAEDVLKLVVVDEDILDEYDPVYISEVPLLFQTGHLTVKQN
jgi:hypothetical protein